ncbi:MAG: DUF6502 family protein [Granulosicoccus sp.]
MSDSVKVSLAKAVVSILRPMIRMLIRFEFTHAELSELVRQTYVEVADKEFVIHGQEMTVSRVAVLTGLSRKEVVRLRALLEDDTTSIKDAPNRAQRVVQGWLGDKEFLDRKKNPKVLPIKGGKGSFLELVKRYSGDITYGAILDELNRTGITSQPDADSVRLINQGYIPHENDLEQVRILSMCVSDLFKTAVWNIEAEPDEKRFQRQVTYNLLDKNSAHEFNIYSKEQASELMEKLNKFLAKKRRKVGTKKQGKSMRVGMGIYYLEEVQESSERKDQKRSK